jgi:hypothetical protein
LSDPQHDRVWVSADQFAEGLERRDKNPILPRITTLCLVSQATRNLSFITIGAVFDSNPLTPQNVLSSNFKPGAVETFSQRTVGLD